MACGKHIANCPDRMAKQVAKIQENNKKKTYIAHSKVGKFTVKPAKGRFVTGRRDV